MAGAALQVEQAESVAELSCLRETVTRLENENEAHVKRCIALQNERSSVSESMLSQMSAMSEAEARPQDIITLSAICDTTYISKPLSSCACNLRPCGR